MKPLCTIPSAILFLVVANAPVAIGQAGLIRGKVVDGGNGKPVEYAYVLNYSQQKQIYCNSNGEFLLNALTGDTLVLYAIGYLYQKILVEDSMINRQQVSFN